MAKILPDFLQLEKNYPTDEDPEKVKKMIGRDVDQDYLKNTCVIRLSRALNYADNPIPRDSAKFRTKLGADDKWYGLRVSEFREYLMSIYGKPAILVRPRSGEKGIDPAQFRGFRGILGLAVDGFSDATGHFTLWYSDYMLYGHMEYFKRSQEAALWTPDNLNSRYYQAPA